jgi:glutamine synthetase
MSSSDIDGILQQAQEAGVEQVRFLYCDNGGIIRGKVAGIEALAGCLKSGIGLTVAMQAMNSLDQLQPVTGMGPVGEIRLVPDLATFHLLPYAPGSAAILCDMVTLEGKAWEACPRSFLKHQLESAASELNFTVQAAFEPEWSLAQRNADGSYSPLDESLCFSSIGMMTALGVIKEIITTLTAQGLKVEQYYPELGHGQQELSISHAEALRSADNQLIYRETVRNVAWSRGLFASFAPKPFAKQAGNGAHIHISAWATGQEERNLFYDQGDRFQLSRLAYHFIGGVLTHLPGLVALTCPTVNSYRRLKPQSWSSAYTCYGPDNREAAVRLASPMRGRESHSANFEVKASDNSNNPYLALGGIIAAGLDGVRRELHPGDGPLLLVDPATLSEEERSARNIRRLPASLGAALDALEHDAVLVEALGPLLTNSYLAVKRSEVAAYAGQDEAFELQHHFFKY